MLVSFDVYLNAVAIIKLTIIAFDLFYSEAQHGSLAVGCLLQLKASPLYIVC